MTRSIVRAACAALCTAALTLGACGDAKKGGEDADHGHDHAAKPAAKDAPAADHGSRRDLGTAKLLGNEFTVALLGELTPGKEAAFEVKLAKGEPGSLRPILWVEDADGKQVGGPENGSIEAGAWHFHVTPRSGTTPVRVVLRLRQGAQDERAPLPLSGHGHEHPATPHDGVVAKLLDTSGKAVGHVELKLHDDKGDLELWLGQDEKLEKPLDLSLDAVPVVTFVDVSGRKVELRVRDAKSNPDEDGTANVRGAATNYFIFPGETGVDAAWLMGKEFRSLVSVRVKSAGGEWVSEEFVLKPHTHDGEGH